ncbi:hypothetical protein LCGC14_2336540 [marine sediment metagenome]|uniref:Uncharacterized protein n=1 Tax=marine sediment metagenome TaxID=412755 RepID=A0A0F9ER48_9ZZZZ
MGALLALAGRVVAPLGRRVGLRFGGRGTAALATIAGGTALGSLGVDALGEVFGGRGDGGAAPRRRRRKALSDTDMRTALTIASAISKKAAENFILMRVRGS